MVVVITEAFLWTCKAIALAILIIALKLFGWWGFCAVVAPFVLYEIWYRIKTGRWSENQHQVIRRQELLDSQKPMHLEPRDE